MRFRKSAAHAVRQGGKEPLFVDADDGMRVSALRLALFLYGCNAECGVKAGLFAQGVTKFVLGKHQLFPRHQGYAQNFFGGLNDFCAFASAEYRQCNGNIFFVAVNQNFRTDHAFFRQRRKEGFFFFVVDAQCLALFKSNVFEYFADSLCLRGDQRPARAGVFGFEHIFSVFGKLFVEAEQDASGVDTVGAEHGGQIDQSGLSLGTSDGDQHIKGVTHAQGAALFRVGAGRAQFGLDLIADMYACVFVAVAVAVRNCIKSVFNAAEYVGKGVKSLSDRGAVAVDGDAAQMVFTVQDQFLFGRFHKGRGDAKKENAGQNAGEQGESYGQRLRGIKTEKKLYCRISEGDGEHGGKFPGR